MIFEEIVLNNFGIYQGSHVLKLAPPSRQKNIILLGGLNGSGKTTLLEGLQLTLYGKLAKPSSRGNMNYHDYLRRMINYHVDSSQGAALELQFRHFKQGKEESIRLHRSWYASGKYIKESVEVKRDGIFDAVLTEHWYDYVDEFIPNQIASLFFFDGEKIEAFAEPNKTAELLKIGINALLGLDLIERLTADLIMVERKRKGKIQSPQIRANITALEQQIEQLSSKEQKLQQQKQEIQSHITTYKEQHQHLLENYRREGGELFEQKNQIDTQLETTGQKLSQIEEQLRELATGEAPLLLVRNLLRDAEQQAILEKQIKRNRTLQEELEKRDTTLLQLLQQHAVNQSALTAIQNFMEADKTKRQQSFEIECYLHLEPTIFAPLPDSLLNQTHKSAQTLVEQAEKVTEELNDCERQLASIPDPESLEGIKEKLQNTQKEMEKALLQLENLAKDQDHIAHELKRKNKALMEAYETEAEEKFADETTNRVLKHSEKVRRTIAQFGYAVTKKHIQQLERLILESFQQLVRKENFINDMKIDLNNYHLTLYTSNQEQQSPEMLSAGERQLLAVSILWGLSRASGRPLPAIIDTPLSRLDSEHRQSLVDNYFHQASHQVILLSTDEEINKKYYQNLKRVIGHEYHIVYQEDKQTSVINPGYFF